MLWVYFAPKEAGCFRRVAALYSDHLRQVPLYIKCLDQGRLAALDRWLSYTVISSDSFYCLGVITVLQMTANASFVILLYTHASYKIPLLSQMLTTDPGDSDECYACKLLEVLIIHCHHSLTQVGCKGLQKWVGGAGSQVGGAGHKVGGAW